MAAKPIYVWTGTEWSLVGDGAGEPGVAYYQTLPPAAPADGTIWVDESGGIPAGISTRVPASMELVTEQSFTAQATVSINNCFTADYENYRVLLDIATASVPDAVANIRWRSAGADNTTANYNSAGFYVTWAGATGVQNNASGATASQLGFMNTAAAFSLEVRSPALTAVTNYLGQFVIPTYGQVIRGRFNAATAFDGFTVYPASGTITGKIAVYGYGLADRYISGQGDKVLPAKGSELYLQENYF